MSATEIDEGRLEAFMGQAVTDMGAVITRQHRDRVLELIEAGVKEGAKIPADGRGVKVSEAPNGFYVGATILDPTTGDPLGVGELFAE